MSAAIKGLQIVITAINHNDSIPTVFVPTVERMLISLLKANIYLYQSQTYLFTNSYSPRVSLCKLA